LYPKIQSKVNNHKAPSKAEVHPLPKLQCFTSFLWETKAFEESVLQLGTTEGC